MGLNSTHGRRGAICAQMGWSWHFLNHEISWALVQRIMSDQARVVDKNKKTTRIEITEDNADSVFSMLKAMF